MCCGKKKSSRFIGRSRLKKKRKNNHITKDKKQENPPT